MEFMWNLCVGLRTIYLNSSLFDHGGNIGYKRTKVLFKALVYNLMCDVNKQISKSADFFIIIIYSF